MAKKKGRKKKKHGYRSQAQVRWAFANKKEFAHRWAKEAKRKKGKNVWYRSLPKKKRGRRKKRK